MALRLVLRADGRLEGFLLLRAPGAAARFEIVAAHGREHRRRLLAPHHRDARIGPHPQQARAIGATAHAVIAGAEAAADDEGEFRHIGAGDRRYHLGAVLGDAARLVFAPDHEAGDVLEKDERDAALRAKLDEMRAFERALGEENTVIGDDADGIAPDARKAGDERLAVELLELVELAAIDDARDDLADIIG